MTLARRILGSAGGSGSFTPTYAAAGNLVASGSPVTIDAGSDYKAFPGLCRTSAGDLLLVYRYGSQHISSDGHTVARVSTDGGATWGTAYTVYDPADDARDPSVATLSDDRIALTTFRYNGTDAYQVEVLFSDDNGATFGTPVIGDTYYAGNGVTYAYAACSAPIVEVAVDRYVWPVYMRNSGGATNWNAFALISEDGGDTFGDAVLIATGGGGSWTEPVIVKLDGDDLLCLIRELNADDIWSSTSSDGGATWSAPSLEFEGDSRVALLRTAHGALIGVYRNMAYDGVYRTSWDDGATWEAAADLPSPSTDFNYAAAAQTTGGTVIVVWANENSSTDADLYAQAYIDSGP